MISHLLTVFAKGNGICSALYGLQMVLLQCVQKPGGFRLSLTDMRWQGLFWVAVGPDLEWLCLKRFQPRTADGNDLWRCGIIGNFYRVTDQLGFGFVSASLKTDACTFINLTRFMVKKSFTNSSRIQKYQRSCITVKLLNG